MTGTENKPLWLKALITVGSLSLFAFAILRAQGCTPSTQQEPISGDKAAASNHGKSQQGASATPAALQTVSAANTANAAATSATVTEPDGPPPNFFPATKAGPMLFKKPLPKSSAQ